MKTLWIVPLAALLVTASLWWFANGRSSVESGEPNVTTPADVTLRIV